MRLMPMVQADDQMHVFLLVLTLQQFEHLVVWLGDIWVISQK